MKKYWKKWLAAILALCLLLLLAPALASPGGPAVPAKAPAPSVSRIMAAPLAQTPPEPTAPSAPSAWAAADVDAARTAGLLPPELDGAYQEPITRREFAALACAYADAAGAAEPKNTIAFPDTGDPSVLRAAALGVIAGYEDGTFRPEETVRRDEAAAMLARCARLTGLEPNAPERAFPDLTGSWAEADASFLAACRLPPRKTSVLNGAEDGSFDPAAPLTREQAAVAFYRLYLYGKQGPMPLAGRLVCVDPGHCVTPEAGKGHRELVSPLSSETKPLYTTGTQGAGMTEEKLNLAVGLKLRDALESLGAEVIMTREVSNITISGIQRCEIANEAGADVCVRIHADGSNDRSVHGVSVLVPAGDLLGTPSIREESVRLGKLMADAVAAETEAKNRGAVPRSDLTGFNFSEVPTVLIEMGFMTNREEDALLETEAYQDKIVSGMVASLLEWYGINASG